MVYSEVCTYLIADSHHFTHFQILYGRTQVSDRAKSQTAVALEIKPTDKTEMPSIGQWKCLIKCKKTCD